MKNVYKILIVLLSLVILGGVGLWGYSIYSNMKVPEILPIYLGGNVILNTSGNTSTVTNITKSGTVTQQSTAGQKVYEENDEQTNAEYQAMLAAQEAARLDAAVKAKNAQSGAAIANGTACGDGFVYYQGNCVEDKPCTGGSSCPINCESLSSYTASMNGGGLVQEPGQSYCDGNGNYCQVTRIEWSSDGANTGTHCFLTQNEDCSRSCTDNERATITTTTTTTSPVMACTSITRAPTTVPTIGSTPVFTCLGTITPPSAGTLSYKFRYKKDSGAYIALTNKTPATAELAITACGTYSVECQACATLEGVLTCDPTWTGATQ